MKIAAKKFLKFPLVLLAFVGLVFSLSCAFNHPEVSAHSELPKTETFLIQGSETCCGTNLSQHRKSLNGEYLTLPRDAHRNFFDLLVLSFVTLSIVFGRHLLDDIGRRLSTLQKLYIRDNPHMPLFNHLILAFSRGILNPKKYNLAFSN